MADCKYRKILFVFRGSTCRSPTAEAILMYLLQEREDRNEDEDDFSRFDVMLAFDKSNVRGLNETFKPNDGTVRLHVFIK